MSNNSDNPRWWIYQGNNKPKKDAIDQLPEAPPWRQFTDKAKEKCGTQFRSMGDKEIELVNAALYLRRPLLVTGKPGTGKTTLAYAVAHELQLGPVLRWSITTRSTLQEGLYRYDAIARLQDASLQVDKTKSPDIGRYLRLGPLGSAFAAQSPESKGEVENSEPPKARPRVLLIDEIDKSDIDLPNDLLHIFEEGEFEIPELARLTEKSQQTVKIRLYDQDETVEIKHGKVRCQEFPFVIMTSNGEKEFPPPFLRRCLRLEMEPPNEERLREIVAAHLGKTTTGEINDLIKEFVQKRDQPLDLANDQLLNAAYLVLENIKVLEREDLKNALWKALSGEEE